MVKLRATASRIPVWAFKASIALICVGLAWGMAFATVPGPDDSPAEAARVALHASVTSLLLLGGVVGAVVSGAILLVRRYS